MGKILKVISLCVCAIAASLLLALKDIQPSHAPVPAGNHAIRTAIDSANDHLVDTAVSMLRSGYLVLRMGIGADSRLLARFNQKNKSYSHCGIVMIEGGKPWVYHAIGGEDNPDERLRRDPAQLFFSPKHNSALAVVRYDLDDHQLRELRKVVIGYYAQKPRFDLKFDLTTDDKLYCAEFVYKALNKATGDSGYIHPTSAAGITYVGTDDLFVNRHAGIVWQTAFK